MGTEIGEGLWLRTLTEKIREEEAFRLRNRRTEGLFRVKRWRSWGLSGRGHRGN